MTSVLDRKLIRDLSSSGGMILAIASIIAVGVASFVALRSAYHNLDEARHRYYAQCRMADFSIELKKAPVVALDALARLPGTTEIRPRLQFSVTVDLDGVEEPLSGLVFSLPERRDVPLINDVVLKRGSYFTDRRDEEVIVNDAFARKHGLHPGDRIHLLLNNRRQALQIVGTAISSEFVYLLGPGAGARPRAFRRLLPQARLSRGGLRLQRRLQPSARPAGAGRSRPARPAAGTGRAADGVLRRVRDHAPARPALEPLLEQRAERTDHLRCDHAGDLPDRRGAGTRRPDGPADRAPADRDRHAQGARLSRRPPARLHPQVRLGGGPHRRGRRPRARLPVGGCDDADVRTVLRVPRAGQPGRSGRPRRRPAHQPGMHPARLHAGRRRCCGSTPPRRCGLGRPGREEPSPWSASVGSGGGWAPAGDWCCATSPALDGAASSGCSPRRRRPVSWSPASCSTGLPST